MIKRIMAIIDSDTKKPEQSHGCATRKPAGVTDSGAGIGARVHVRSVQHYRAQRTGRPGLMFTSGDHEKFRTLRIAHLAVRFAELITDETNDELTPE